MKELNKSQENLNISDVNESLDEDQSQIVNMKTLLIQALDDAFVVLEKQVPNTKKKMEFMSILDIKPSEISSLMKENDIPDDAYFTGRDNGDDGWDDILLAWDVDIPTTEKDKILYKRKTFSTIAFRKVYELLTTSGYKRVGFSTGLLKQFDDTTVYDMYMNKDFDRLVKYYSLPFVKI
jgi:hypothetical protein